MNSAKSQNEIYGTNENFWTEIKNIVNQYGPLISKTITDSTVGKYGSEEFISVVYENVYQEIKTTELFTLKKSGKDFFFKTIVWRREVAIKMK